MRPAHATALLRALALIAVAASTALYLDYTSVTPAFCGAENSGCFAVRKSGFGFVPLPEALASVGLGYLPVPLFGLLGFTTIFALSLVRADSHSRRWLLPLTASLGGVVALGLLALQALYIKALCSFCVVVDVAAINIAWLGWLARRDDDDAPLLATWAWLSLAAMAVAVPLTWRKVRPQTPVSPAILALYQPGKINVVEFADFECPYCRMLHPRLKLVMASYPGRVNFVRRQVPLEMHEHANGAARAFLCADAQGRGDVMAEKLVSNEDLSPAANRRAAVSLGVDAAVYDACLEDPRTQATIDEHKALLHEAGYGGLPTTFVGGRRLTGALPEEVFRDAFDRAAQGEEGGVPGFVFAPLALLVVAGVAWRGRLRTAA